MSASSPGSTSPSTNPAGADAPAPPSRRVAVLGAGSWGTTFAKILADGGNDVALWARRPELAREISQSKRNSDYLPGINLPRGLWASASLPEVLEGAEQVYLSVPSQSLRENLRIVRELIPDDALIVSLMKGVEKGTGSRMSEVIRQELKLDGERVAVASGPNLALSTSDLSSKIPAFNAQRLLTDVGSTPTAADDASNAAEPDAEVSFVTRDLGTVLPRARISASVAIEDVLMRVRDASSWRNQSGVRYTMASATPDAAAVPGDMKMAYATEGAAPDPYAGFEARIVPENVTLLPKTKDQITGGSAANERVHVVKKGDTVISVLVDQGATPEEARAIATTLGPRGRDGGLREGQKLRILMEPSAPGKRLQPYRVIVAGDSTIEAVVALSDLGRYVPVDAQSFNTATATTDSSDDDEEDDGRGVRLYQSIYETALRYKVPTSVIEDMIRIYSYDVDFQRRAQAGDSFEVFYASDDETTPMIEKDDVLFASLTVGGETKKYYRFQTADDGIIDYYDESGKSAKKFLVRKPVNNAIMRSGFGARRHPILGYTKMHTGIDWASPYGTPIFASGNGIVERVGWEGGYGKYIRLKHNNGYETAYGHMSAYAKGIEPGKRVRQGQVIGFVGSTGQSTGAHVHYEILVNGRFVDPMRIRLPRGRSLEGPQMASFEKERNRIDGLMTSRLAPRVSENVTAQPVSLMSRGQASAARQTSSR